MYCLDNSFFDTIKRTIVETIPCWICCKGIVSIKNPTEAELFPYSKARYALFLWAIIAVSLLLPSPFLYGQADTSSASGTITDSSGALIPNAKVVIHNEATGAERTATTNAGGAYTVPNLAPGSYTVRVEASGFQTAVRSGNHLDPNIGSRIDVTLQSGSTKTTGTVQADANVLQT